MKIGIITFWQSRDNYGQLLQCYALQAYLRARGHEPFLIRFAEDTVPAASFKLKNIPRYLSSPATYFKLLGHIRKEKSYQHENSNAKREFDKFLNQHVAVSSEIYASESLLNQCPRADAYICGSDQIWGGVKEYYLSFVPQGKKKIAYAPSFGGTNPFEKNNPEEIKRLLNDFQFIGVREEEGVKLLKENGFADTELVPDPTLLLTAEDYGKIASNSKLPQSAKGAFVYLLGNDTTVTANQIFSYLATRGLDYKYVASQGRVDKYYKVPLTIPQWLSELRDSRLVITNSFHCVVFALQFHVPFVFLPLAGGYARMNGRLTTLLGNAGLLDRIYKSGFDDIAQECSFETFDKYIAGERNRINNLFKTLLR